jgi:putative membrane protein
MTEDVVADRRVHPATIPLRFLKDAPSTLLGLPAGYALISKGGLGGALLGLVVVAVFTMLYQWLAWSRFRYGIGEAELVVEKGILSRTRRSIPFDRIQDVDIERGPLARIFGLARLRIETGGGGSDEGVLDSVTVAEAERLRAALRSARRPISTEETAIEDTQAEAQILFEMEPPRVLAAGLFNFSMVYIAGIFALLQTFGDWLPFDMWDRNRWAGIVGDRLSPRAIAAVALIAILLGVVTGVARTLARDFGFRLSLEREGLRRQRGLFTRSDVLIPRKRMQLALLDRGLLRRLFGYSELTFQTLGSGAGEGQQGPQSAAPLATAAEVATILDASGSFRTADPGSLEMVSRRRILRMMVPLGIPLLAIGIASLFLAPMLLLLPILALAIAHALIERRYHRLGIADDLLFIQRGVLHRRQWIIPLDKVQSLRLDRSWLQRRLRLSTLHVDTAGAPLLRGANIADLDERRAREVMAQIMTRS